MRARAKLLLVGGGYVAAFAVAWATVAAYVAFTNGPDRQASGGMYAFGDSLLFLAVFGAAAVPASGAGLYFLRPYQGFWRVLSTAALVACATGVAAVGVYLGARVVGAGSILQAWSGGAVLRILVAPLFVLGFALAGVIAPTRSTRVRLLAAAAIELLAFGAVALAWLTQLVR